MFYDQPKKPKSVGPHKLISKKNWNKKKSCLGNKKFRSVNKSLYGIHVDFDNDDDYTITYHDNAYYTQTKTRRIIH